MSLREAIAGFVAQALKPAGQDSAPPKDDPARKGRLLKSWAGLAIVCVVVAVFVLTATFLKSVLFGLILAYFFLPMEKFFERRLMALLKGQTREALALRASLLTFAAIGLGAILAASAALAFALPAIHSASDRIKGWVASNDTLRHIETQIKGSDIEATRQGDAPDAGRQPKGKGKAEIFALWVASQMEAFLEGKDARQELASLALDNKRGIVSGAAFVARIVSTMLFDALLSVFFFFYFLQKMAVFASAEKEKGAGSTGAWLVGGIFESSWMPKTDDSSRLEAIETIDRILEMLRTWARGYLSIVIIEILLYVAAFLLFRVPYALPLGVFAGCTILLPFIGPLASAVLTVSVCMAGGAANIFTIGGALASYLLINGALEQFILYPRFIGEALGLTLLETVIVVLLGGLFAGVPGMIFAVPAASVLKYMVPTIYRRWNPAGLKGPGNPTLRH